LLLRFSGCRISEAIAVDDTRDVDFRNGDVVLPTLKRHGKSKGKVKRTDPLSANVFAEWGKLLAQFPELRGKLFKLHHSTVFLTFQKLAEKAGLASELRHPHILRHTKAIELLRAGVSLTIVQQLLGHATISTTAVYLRFSGVEIKQILRDKDLI